MKRVRLKQDFHSSKNERIGQMIFDLNKIFDLSNMLALSDTLLESKNYNNTEGWESSVQKKSEKKFPSLHHDKTICFNTCFE